MVELKIIPLGFFLKEPDLYLCQSESGETKTGVGYKFYFKNEYLITMQEIIFVYRIQYDNMYIPQPYVYNYGNIYLAKKLERQPNQCTHIFHSV